MRWAARGRAGSRNGAWRLTVFKKRLRWFIALMIAVALVIIARLVDIQVVRAEHYQTLADRILTRSPNYLTAPRGSILDRNGAVLVSDEPAFDIGVRYKVLTALLAEELPDATRDYLGAVAQELRKRGRYPADTPTGDIVKQLRAGFAPMLQRLSALTGVSEPELIERTRQVQRRVDSIKADVQRRSPTVREIEEETLCHALVAGADEEVALAAGIELEGEYPWLRVMPSSRRVAHDADALVHVLGRIGAASPQRIEADPLRDDELRSLRSGDSCGITGVERLAELTLRGTHGRIVEDFDRVPLERTLPVQGRDVCLTIDADLQRKVLARLKEAVDESENPSGGAAVVLDVATREVLALVSYPIYSYARFSDDYDKLRRDARWMPLRFRAVANQYPPGSTCKVIGLYGGLAEGVVGEHEQILCTGHFLPNRPDKFRCWIYNQYGTTHGPQDADDAIRNSCNIYFFTVGDRLGVERLCAWFSRFGLGRAQGTGLIEESAGIVPSEEWLRETHGRGFRAADAWNYAIGQGEVTATPLQAANVAATIAAGRWEPVHLLRDDDGAYIGGADEPPVELDERYARILRGGMWRVVNERGATAYAAKLDSGDYVMCGKTGSAQAMPRVLTRRYTCQWPDGRRETVVAGSKADALARFEGARPEIVGWRAHERYPAWQPEEKLPAHAWFIGYTQPADTPRGAAPHRGCYAISVVVEYGGSGGRVAGPVAKSIAEMLAGQR
jgi:cell division protein FtsI/penicillin-binding protein 2